MIEVRLFATFREGREKILYLDSNQFKIAGEVLDFVNIPHEQVAIYLINGRHSKVSDSIKDGDILAIFPPVGGG
ncbi:MAG: MoaD/ThiS family protein [Clostridiaceae bacterium]